MSVDDDPPSAPQGSTEVTGPFWGLDVYCFQVCSLSSPPCQGFSWARLCWGKHRESWGTQEVPTRKGQTEHRGPTASGNLNWAAVPANEKPPPSLGRSSSHKPRLERCRKRSGRCLWLGLSPACPWLHLTPAAGKRGRGDV